MSPKLRKTPDCENASRQRGERWCGLTADSPRQTASFLCNAPSPSSRQPAREEIDASCFLRHARFACCFAPALDSALRSSEGKFLKHDEHGRHELYNGKQEIAAASDFAPRVVKGQCSTGSSGCQLRRTRRLDSHIETPFETRPTKGSLP